MQSNEIGADMLNMSAKGVDFIFEIMVSNKIGYRYRPHYEYMNMDADYAPDLSLFY
jgi:hypothetical protein